MALNFDAEIARVNSKIQQIRDLAELYASMALDETIALEVTLEQGEDSIFYDALSFQVFKSFYRQVFQNVDTISFGIKFDVDDTNIVSKSLKINEVLGRYADSFYKEVERILNVR